MELSLTTLAVALLVALVYLVLTIIHFEKEIGKLKEHIKVLETYAEIQVQFFRIDAATGKAYFKDEVYSGCGEDINNINS